MAIYPRPLASAGHKKLAYTKIPGRSFREVDRRLIWESSVNFYNWKDTRQWYGKTQRMEILKDESNQNLSNNIKGVSTISLSDIQTGAQPAGFDYVEWENQDTEWNQTNVQWDSESGSGDATEDIDIGFLYVINSGEDDALLSQYGEFAQYGLVIPAGGHLAFSGHPPGDNDIPGLPLSNIYVKPKNQSISHLKLKYLVLDYARGN